MAERHSSRARADDDWYVEPPWCVYMLTRHVPALLSVGRVHDPCCGGGTIPRVLAEMGVAVSGADLRVREPGWGQRDFLTDPGPYDAIVTNPPYKQAQAIVEHALKVVRPGGLVCALVQSKFLFSQRRHQLFTRPETSLVLMLSRRPSMPPGEELAKHGEDIRGGGSLDFCWVVWQVGRIAVPPHVEWAK